MIIYKITNLKNNKVYIGQTRQTLKQRLQRHFSRAKNEFKFNYCLCNAIRKYGKNSFVAEVIDIADSKERLDELEIYWINKYNSLTPNGYNMTSGGGGTSSYTHTDETKEIMSKKKRGMYFKENNPFYNKTHSKEQIEKWSKERKDVKLSQEHKEKISATRKRKKIINIDTGEVFESARHVARHYGKNPDSGTSGIIAKVCKKQPKYKTCLGFRFEYYDENVHDNTVPSLKHIKEGVTTS